MKANLAKFFNDKKTKAFWLYIVLGAFLMIAAIMLMPFWKSINDKIFFANWGDKVLNIVIACLLILYIMMYLFPRLRKGGTGSVAVLAIIEFVLLAIVALGCILAQFKILNISGVSAILGLALWLRGVIEVFRAYYYNRTANTTYKFPVWRLVVAILLISFGVFFMVSSVIKDVAVLWLLTITLLIVGLIIFLLGFVKKPESKKVKTAKKEKTEKEEKKD